MKLKLDKKKIIIDILSAAIDNTCKLCENKTKKEVAVVVVGSVLTY